MTPASRVPGSGALLTPPDGPPPLLLTTGGGGLLEPPQEQPPPALSRGTKVITNPAGPTCLRNDCMIAWEQAWSDVCSGRATCLVVITFWPKGTLGHPTLNSGLNGCCGFKVLSGKLLTNTSACASELTRAIKLNAVKAARKATLCECSLPSMWTSLEDCLFCPEIPFRMPV